MTVSASACRTPASASRLSDQRARRRPCRGRWRRTGRRASGRRAAACAARCARSRRCSSSIPASRATASRCRTPLVEPPDAQTQAIAFSSDSRVMISLGRRSSASTCITSSPTCSATVSLVGRPSAGTIAEPIGEIPSTSKAQAIVLAVNWPPQAPAPGLAHVLELAQLLVGHLARGVGADRLEDVLDRHVAGRASGRARSSRRRASPRGRRAGPAPSRSRGSSCRRPRARPRRRTGSRARSARSSRRSPRG